MKFTFDIGTKLVVTLKETCYFESWCGTREVSLMSLETVKRNFDCPDGPSMQKFKTANILAVKTIIGRYVGERYGDNKIKIIKIEPFCSGLMHPDSEYFIIYPEDIYSINEYQLVPNE